MGNPLDFAERWHWLLVLRREWAQPPPRHSQRRAQLSF
jgi:hypothetical protein